MIGNRMIVKIQYAIGDIPLSIYIKALIYEAH